MISEAKVAYLAGIIDGEGTIGFYQRSNGYGSAYYVAVWNTDLELITWVHENFGGKFWTQLRNGPLGTKPLYRVIWNKRIHIIAVLEQVLPFLIVKKERANDMLGFLSLPYRERDEFLANLKKGK